MIDFRYHLVSIIAVFLALAVGLLVGSTALSGKAVEVLTTAQRAALSNNAKLEKQLATLNNQLSADQAFAAASEKRLLSGLLVNQTAVIVTAPGSDQADTNGIRTALTEAGAKVTGEVDLQSSFVSTTGQTETALNSLAQSLASQAGVTLSTQPSSGVSGQQAVAQLLAASLLAGSGTALSTTASAQILNGLSQGSYLSVSATSGAKVPAPATLAVLVTPSGAPPQSGGLALWATALALKKASDGTVMAGPASAVGTSSVIATENSQPQATQVSTVDNVDTASGQIMTVQALYYAMHGKPAGQYGISSQTAPSPAPSPTPTVTLTPSSGTHSPGAHK